MSVRRFIGHAAIAACVVALGVAPVAAAGSIPPDAKVSGTNGGAAIGQSAGVGASAAALPGGYCTTYWWGSTNTSAHWVRAYSEGVCSGPIGYISTSAFLYKGSSLKATGSDIEYSAVVSLAMAQYNCGSGCAGTYHMTSTQHFYNVSGWAGAIGLCAIHGGSMDCAGSSGNWTY